MGYIRFTDAVGRENILDASRVLIVREQGSNIDFILDFHTVATDTGGVVGGVRKQIRLVGTGFSIATIKRINLAKNRDWKIQTQLISSKIEQFFI